MSCPLQGVVEYLWFILTASVSSRGSITEFFGWIPNLVGLKPVGSEDGRHLTMSQLKTQGSRFKASRFKTLKFQGQDHHPYSIGTDHF